VAVYGHAVPSHPVAWINPYYKAAPPPVMFWLGFVDAGNACGNVPQFKLISASCRHSLITDVIKSWYRQYPVVSSLRHQQTFFEMSLT